MSVYSDSYFDSYGDLQIHEIMLNDRQRMEAYKEAIVGNADFFEGKTVLDVGAGTGILSLFCAQAGARKIYSVEANPKLIPIIKNLADENNFSDVIVVIFGEMEKTTLPENVDIIISEWMGFFLLHEGMLNSVLFAKKFLKEDGVLLPDECNIYVALCELPQYFSDWENKYGVRLTGFGEAYRKSVFNKPEIGTISSDLLISESKSVHDFRLADRNEEDFRSLSKRFVLPVKRNGNLQGVCLWFSVDFRNGLSKTVTLSTSPDHPQTHWKQTLIVLPSEIPVEESEPVAFELSFVQKDVRRYDITLEILESDQVEHDKPCDCYDVKCRIVKAYMNEHPSD